MANDPLQFVDIYGSEGIGFVVGDTQPSSETDRKRAANDAYVTLAGIKGYWRKRDFEYTGSSSIALVAGTRKYNVPTSPAFDSPFRLWYVQSGIPTPIKIVKDDIFLQHLRVGSNDKGTPRFARLIQGSSSVQLEFNIAFSSNFISNNIPLTLEYWIAISRLVNDTDEPILPANLRHHITTYGAWLYADGQNDYDLKRSLENNALIALRAVKRHDATRTGRPGQIVPEGDYFPPAQGDGVAVGTDYES